MDKPLPTLDSVVGDPSTTAIRSAIGMATRWWWSSTGFIFKTFLDATGLPHGDEMTTVERIRKIGNQLEDVVTIHDPEMYMRDWQARFVYDARNDVRLEDYACNDTASRPVRREGRAGSLIDELRAAPRALPLARRYR